MAVNLQYEFLNTPGTVALYGLPRSGKGFGWEVLRAVQAGGLDVSRTGVRESRPIYAVHPAAEGGGLHGVKAVRSARKIQPAPELAVIVLKPEDARKALEDAADAGVRKVWLVMNACSPANREYAESRGMQVAEGCPLLFVDKPWFPHNIHRALAKLFGKL